jgi:hypothetical protein
VAWSGYAVAPRPFQPHIRSKNEVANDYRDWLIGAAFSGVGFDETMVAVNFIEHQIEAAPVNAFARYLHAKYRVLDQFVE